MSKRSKPTTFPKIFFLKSLNFQKFLGIIALKGIDYNRNFT